MNAPRALVATLVALSLAVAAQAGPAVTVYSGDLAFVREIHVWDVRAAEDTLRINDLPATLDATSVRVALGGAGRVTRLAYRGDLESGEAALSNALGSRVGISARDDRTVLGTLLSADATWLLVRDDDGQLHNVARSAVEVVRMHAGPDRMLRPTLEVAIAGGRTGAMDLRVDYLTGGMSWSAEHTIVRGDGNRADWSTMITVVNRSGREYADAQLKLVAGDPRRTRPSPQPVLRTTAMKYADEAAGAPPVSGEVFSEYHLYTLDPPATLRDRESQQLSMYAPRGIAVRPHYLYRAGAAGVLAQLKIDNEKGKGPGVPLPGGRVRVFEADASGALQFTGESHLRHTPVDEEFTIDVGTVFDLVAERRVVREQRISNRERKTQVEVQLRNAKKSAVTIRLEEPLGGDFEITSSSHPFERKDSRTAVADVQVPAGKEVVVTYEATIRF